ncbi:MAG: nucleoid occlusion protein [Candidatus Syntrophonatronum acetioxidans]|uniref:Nucleoid occlusion protein n=1 Tax=Candidatus Syntrophonatronum acetioxidans TaxID=1795816 RepID=A0A424YBF4_9FIRM|nr:MAG: nucleoid occlusion protein [Candidatus Syntrophonatronum acetioxidans]
MKETWAKIFGLDAQERPEENLEYIEMDNIEGNPFQPRKEFDQDKIGELAQSIKTYGLLQPILVAENDKKYQIIAGERRYLACKKLGWVKIPAIKKEISTSGMAAMALIENLQRENLHYMEEAQGYHRLIEEFGLTQEVLAQRLGKSQSTIANKLRLLKLPEGVKENIKAGDLTERHARALLKLEEERAQEKIVQRVVEESLNVSQTEKLIEENLNTSRKSSPASKKKKKVVIRDIRIFLNTIRQALKIIKDAGMTPLVTEKDEEDHYEIIIKLPKDRG